MKKKLMINNLLIVFLTIFLFSCSNKNIEITIKCEDTIIIGESITIDIVSTLEDDFFELNNITPEIIQIKDDYIIIGLSEGVGKLEIKNKTGIIKYLTICVLDNPIPESIDINFYDDNFVMKKVYKFEVSTVPSNAKKNLRVSYDSTSINLNLDTYEIEFLYPGTYDIVFYSNDNLKAKKAITCNVDFNSDVEYYELLFIGNSLTKNALYDIPMMIKLMMETENIGVRITVDDCTPQWIIDHKRNFNDLIEQRKYSHVILQERSHGPVSDYQKFLNAVVEFNEKIKLNGAKLVLYQTWPYNDGYNGMTKYEMYLGLKEGYVNVAKETNGMLSKVGDAYTKFEELYPNNVSLYSDRNHASIYGAYLSACVHYSTLTGEKSVLNSYVYPDIEYDIAMKLKEVADMIVFSE